MSTGRAGDGRIIPVDVDLIGESGSRPTSLQPRKLADYPGIPSDYLHIALNYSNPLLAGPPICDELIALVQHMFTAEEAAVVRHIKSPLGKTARTLARITHRPVAEVRSILERLAYGKYVLFAFGSGKRKRYGLMPLVPGVFELALIRTSLDSLTNWDRRFAELFEALYSTGYFVEYVERPLSSVRYVPAGKTIEAHPMARPSDRLEEVLDRYDLFGVGLCQCRMSAQIGGRGCDKPLENCVGFGDLAGFLIGQGKMRRVTRRDVEAIKAEAAAAGLVSFVMEIEAGKSRSGASCSCCGCCCGALRLIRDFDAPGLIAPPRFMPEVDLSRCTYCGRCAQVCPTSAMAVDPEGKSHLHLSERCIGCGFCATACDRQHAIRMEARAGYHRPPTTPWSALMQMGPNYLRNAWSVWRKHR